MATTCSVSGWLFSVLPFFSVTLFHMFGNMTKSSSRPKWQALPELKQTKPILSYHPYLKHFHPVLNECPFQCYTFSSLFRPPTFFPPCFSGTLCFTSLRNWKQSKDNFPMLLSPNPSAYLHLKSILGFPSFGAGCFISAPTRTILIPSSRPRTFFWMVLFCDFQLKFLFF